VNRAALLERLRELEARGRLEKVLVARDEALPWTEVLWLLQYPAMLGVAIHVVCMANAAAATGGAPPAIAFVWLVVLALVAIALRHGWRFARTPAQRLRVRLREHGVLAAGAIVQVNDAFWGEDNDQWLPGSVLVSFDPDAWQRPEALAASARRLFALRDSDRRTLPPEQAALAWDLYHSMWLVQSSRVPSELCDGLRDCWLATAMFPPLPLRDGELLVVLALPGETSPDALALLPAAVVDADGSS
jgi:hypothetical protein